ncbi:MAG: ABC transporter ATP-binding protein [Myxococcaceae bacterium]|nr:ABC transporter ATP-binding protein [Myxococcaceae bacterium]MCI0672355.1 ABC transporter ATP-binding protein [Myxococcaceae bacterium]
MIAAHGIRKSYREGNGSHVRVLEGLDLEVALGEFVAVVGPSGCGKSSLLHILGGLDRDFEGRAHVAGTELHALDDAGLSRLRNEKVGFVFQSFHLLPHLTALENVALPAQFSPGWEPRVQEERARKVLQRVGLEGKEGRTPARLSGGERQRVAIARALFAQPQLLMCDEPTGNLDQETGAGIIELFRSLHRDGLTVLVVTHEDQMRAAAQRVLRLQGGRLHPEGQS